MGEVILSRLAAPELTTCLPREDLRHTWDPAAQSSPGTWKQAESHPRARLEHLSTGRSEPGPWEEKAPYFLST